MIIETTNGDAAPKYIIDYHCICYLYRVTLQLENRTVSGWIYSSDATTAATRFLESEGDSLRSEGRLTVRLPSGARAKFWYRTEPHHWSCPGGQHWDTYFLVGQDGKKASVSGCLSS